MSDNIFSVWEGVYKSFNEAGGDLDAFDSSIWIEKQQHKIIRAIEDYKTNKTTSKDYPLPLVVSMILSQNKKINILDFGGGMGAQYIDIISKVPQALDLLEYYVIDGKSSTHNKPKALDQFHKLYFFNDFNEIKCNFDIIHIGSTLQYIEKWEELLQFLKNKFSPKYFVFSDLLVGNIPTFVSHQIFYNKKIPHIFINIREFENFIIKNLKMQNIFKAKFVAQILNQTAIFPNHGLPEEYRIDRAYNLVYRA